MVLCDNSTSATLTRELGAPLKTYSPSSNAVSKKLTDLMSGFWLFKVHWLLIEFLSPCNQMTGESPAVTEEEVRGRSGSLSDSWTD